MAFTIISKFSSMKRHFSNIFIDLLVYSNNHHSPFKMSGFLKPVCLLAERKRVNKPWVACCAVQGGLDTDIANQPSLGSAQQQHCVLCSQSCSTAQQHRLCRRLGLSISLSFSCLATDRASPSTHLAHVSPFLLPGSGTGRMK